MVVSPRFEPLRRAYEEATAGAPGGGALAVTVDGQQVLSTWRGQAAPGTPWAEDTPALLMSVTKGFAAMCLQVLADRGELDVEAPVTKYWPEYGANGKQDTLVSHVLLHTAGVLGWPEAGNELKPDGTGWQDLDLIAARLAAVAPAWKPGTRHGYHAVSYGWLTGELVRRITGQTLGTFFHENIATPLGIRTAIGVDADRAAEVAQLETAGMGNARFPLSLVMKKAAKRMREPGNLQSLAFLGNGTTSIMDSLEGDHDRSGFMKAEVPSSNGISSAADLARLFAVLANGGQVDGVRILSERIVAEWALPMLKAGDAVMGDIGGPLGGLLENKLTSTRTYGYIANTGGGLGSSYGPCPGAFGSEGAGGQIVIADPKNHVSMALVRSDLSASTKLNKTVVSALYECLDV